MKTFTNAILSDSTIGAKLTEALKTHDENAAAIIETAKFFAAQKKEVQEIFGAFFSSNPHSSISRVKDLAAGNANQNQALVGQMNKAGWNAIESIVSPELCSLAKRNFKNNTIWATEIPVLNHDHLIDQLDKIADIQKVALDANVLSKEIAFNEGEEIELDQFKAKKITLDQIDQLHSLIAQMQMHIVNIQTKAHFKTLSNESIKNQLAEAQLNHGQVKTQILEVKFFKNGNIEVKSPLRTTIVDFN